MSGSTIGGFAGAAIGFWFGGPTGARWGFMIGSAVGGYVDPVEVSGPRLTDAQTQTSQEGAPRSIVYGTACVAGNIIQCGPLVEHKKKQRQGKGGPEVTSYTYTRTVAIRICEAAPLGGTMRLRRVWKDDKLVADWSEANTIPADTAAFESILTFYSGAESQLPDPSLEALPAANGGGVGNVPAYRGTCYAVLTDLDCTDRQGAVPQFRWEVSSDATEVEVTSAWGHSSTGYLQTNFSRDISASGTCMVAGWNNNLRRSVGGLAWSGISYTAALGWSSGSTIGNIWWAGGKTWYMAKFNQVAVSYDDGKNWMVNNTPFYDIRDSSVGIVDGEAWVGLNATPGGHGSNTCIFKPLATADSLLDLGVAAGQAKTIAQCNGVRYVGSTNGSIIRASTVVDSAASNVLQFANIGATILAARLTGYSYSVDDGVTWTYSTDVAMWGVATWNGFFYAATKTAILRSATGLPGSWEVIDNYFVSNSTATAIKANLGGLFALNQAGSKVAANVPAAGGIAIPDVPGHWLLPDGSITGITAKTITPGMVALPSIVTDLCERAGVGSDQVDVSALAGIEVRGFPVSRQTTPAEAIRALQDVFFFDFPEYGNSGEATTKLRAVLRGGPVRVTITDDDLVENDDDEGARPQPVEFPRKVSLTAADPEAGYEPATQPAAIDTENVQAVGEISVSTAVVMTRDEIAAVVDKLLKTTVEEASGRLSLELPEEFSRYTPSDVASYQGRRLRIEKAERAEGTVRWELKRDRASASASIATGSPAPTPTTPVSSIRGPTMAAFLNLPRLRSSDTTPGIYVGVCGLLPGWSGCDLYLSVDGGVTEQKIATLIDPATMGTLSADLAVAGSPLSVSLYDGELDSATAEQLLARLNAAAVTTASASEILQFQTATGTAAKAYDLTGLARGVLGTSAAQHYAGDSFVLLDGVQLIPLDIGLAGKTLIFRPVSIGTAPANNPTYSVVFQPKFTGPQVVEAYTDDAGNAYTDDAGNPYYYEVPSP